MDACFGQEEAVSKESFLSCEMPALVPGWVCLRGEAGAGSPCSAQNV